MKQVNLCYILPEYSRNSSQHYYHQVELLQNLSKNFRVFLFIESGNTFYPWEQLAGFYLQKFKWMPLAVLERLVIFIWLRIKGFTYFYCHYAQLSCVLVSIVTKVLGGKVYKWHCAQEHYYQKPWRLVYFKEKIIRELPFWLSLKLCDYLVTCTFAMKHYFNSYFSISKKKIIIFPNFINLDRFFPAQKSKLFLKTKLNLPDQPILLFIHWLSERKGADRLIDIANEIKKQSINLHIVAIGEGPLLASLKKLRRIKKLESCLTFLGPVSNKKIPQYLQASDILLMPSRVEEFGRVQIEAMACGLPIIQTKTVASKLLHPLQKKYVLSQSDFILIPKLANKLIESQRLYQQQVDIGLKWVQKFGLERAVINFSNLFL